MSNKTWEYRVVRKESDNGSDAWYSVQEVYFDDDGKPSAQTIDLQIEGDTISEIRKRLNGMIKCLNGPVLDEEEIIPNVNKRIKENIEYLKTGKKTTTQGVPFSCGGVYNSDNNYEGPESEYLTKLEKISNDGRGNDIYIYESPDGGQTIYRREFGKDEKEEI